MPTLFGINTIETFIGNQNQKLNSQRSQGSLYCQNYGDNGSQGGEHYEEEEVEEGEDVLDSLEYTCKGKAMNDAEMDELQQHLFSNQHRKIDMDSFDLLEEQEDSN